MKKFNPGGRLTSVFLLLTLLVYMTGCVCIGAAEPINPNNDGQDPYDWSNYPGEVILDAPEFIQGDETDGAAEPEEVTGTVPENEPDTAGGATDEQASSPNEAQTASGEQQENGDHIPLQKDSVTKMEAFIASL